MKNIHFHYLLPFKSGHLKRHQPKTYTMSDPSTLREYFVYVPDHPNAHEKRREFVKQHNQEAGPLVKAGRVPWFGSTLDHHGREEELPAEAGTVMVLKAENEEEVKEIIKRDIFVSEGVWNFEQLQVWPFLSKM